MVARSLRNRITLWFTATVIATFACLLLVLHLRMQEDTTAQLTREMESTRAVFLSQHRSRADTLAATARLLGDLPKLGAAIAGSRRPEVGPDIATITDVVRDLRTVVACDVLIVTDERGSVVGDSRKPPAIREDDRREVGVASALRGQVWSGTVVERRRIYQYASAPIRIGGEILGTVRVGLETNNQLARKLSQETRSQISFFNGDSLVASSLERPERAELHSELVRQPSLIHTSTNSEPFTVRLGGRPFLSLARPILAREDHTHVTYVIQRSLNEALEPYRTVQHFLLLAGFLGLVIAAVVSYAVASGIAEPVLRIVKAAEGLARGDWSQRVATNSADEVGVLARTFNSMAAKLQSWDADLRGAVAERTAELNAMVARLDSAFEQMRRFNADASHELRTPLTIVRGEAEVALRSPRALAEYQRVLQSILEETERMAHIIDDLLFLARADSGELILERSLVPLHDLLLELQQPAGVLARQRDIDLSFVVNGPLYVAGDPLRLHQLFLNLLDNAVKYTPAGGAVRVTAESEEGRVLVRVADTGIGIDPRHLPHLFDRFFRVDKARSREVGGSGLGLSICKWIVEAHGGAISVSSAPGQGSTFTVSLKAGTVVPGDHAPSPSRAGTLRES